VTDIFVCTQERSVLVFSIHFDRFIALKENGYVLKHVKMLYKSTKEEYLDEVI
jgi:hypothetical protein